MRAYNLAMLMIFINCGFAIMNSLNIFHYSSEYTGVWANLQWLTSPLGSMTIAALAGLMALGVLLSADRGLSYTTFSAVYWISFSETSILILKPISEYPGLGIFYLVFAIASILIFVMSLIQMPLGGVKGHV